MPWLTEIINSLQGAFLLAKRDLDGYALFNRTADGFWRSFAAIILIAPLYVIYSVNFHQIAVELIPNGSPTDGPDLATDLLGLVFQWIGFPLAMVVVSRMLQITRLFAVYIIAYNWSSVLVMGVIAVPALLYQLGLLGAGLASLVNVVLLFPVLYYRWFITRTALDVNASIAAAIVGMDFVLSILLLDLARFITG